MDKDFKQNYAKSIFLSLTNITFSADFQKLLFLLKEEQKHENATQITYLEQAVFWVFFTNRFDQLVRFIF